MSTKELTNEKQTISVSEIAITGVCIALTFIAIGFINIRLPIAANADCSSGKCTAVSGAIIFGKRTGALAGSIEWHVRSDGRLGAVGTVYFCSCRSDGIQRRRNYRETSWIPLECAGHCCCLCVKNRRILYCRRYHLWKLDCTGSHHSGQPGSDWCGSCSGSSDCRSSQKSYPQIRKNCMNGGREKVFRRRCIYRRNKK